MKPMLALWLPGKVEGTNALHRLHFQQVGKLRAELKDATYLVAKDAVNRHRWEAPEGKAIVRVTYWFKDHRRRDPDNYVAALKGMLDALVLAGVLKDDDFHHVELRVDAEFGQRAVGMHVEVEPWSEA